MVFNSRISFWKAFEWVLGRSPLSGLRELLLKMQSFLRYSPHSHPQPLSRPAGRERGANSLMWPRVLRGRVQRGRPTFKVAFNSLISFRKAFEWVLGRWPLSGLRELLLKM